MDLIGEERGRLARAASWLEATPAEVVGLAVLLVCALGATGVLVWSAFGRPALPHGASVGAGEHVGDVGQVGAAAGSGGAAPEDEADAAPWGGHEHDGGAPGSIDGPGGDPGDGPDTGGEVTVHVAGAVAAPGVVTLPAGSRVTDAVDAAGGLLGDADPSRINLARPLEDGEQLLILREGEEAPQLAPGRAEGPSAAEGAASAGGGPVDLNRATVDQLQALPGIGPAIAARIVQHRDQHGPFRTPGDLRDVSGIGEKRFQDLADLVTVG